jgi:Domain of unknown function (DUF4167)
MNNNRQPMNNNNNNRRRGRNTNNNSNRQQQNNSRSGFDYLNQIDNKARGNASQMLEKYKKLASDAQQNGDRVTAESYLQFADHYFRVLADFRSRQEARTGESQARQPRSEWQNDEAREEGRENTFTEQDSNESEVAFESDASEASEGARPESQERAPRPPRRDPRPERSRQPRRHHSEEPREDEAGVIQGGLDLAVLPPSISISNDFEDEAAAKPVRKPRARRPKSANDESVVAAAE